MMLRSDHKSDHQPQSLDFLILILLAQPLLVVAIWLQHPVGGETTFDGSWGADVDPDGAGEGTGGRKLRGRTVCENGKKGRNVREKSAPSLQTSCDRRPTCVI